MIVVGGVYIETCLVPGSTVLLGSAGRAALALTSLSPSVVLHTFYPEVDRDDVVASFSPAGIEVHITPSSDPIEFTYLHPLSRPRIAPIPLPLAKTVEVRGETILRYGCLEGGFKVEARAAVYDPQSGAKPDLFGTNGSKAERLAVVLNTTELATLTQLDDIGAAAQSLAKNANVIVVKAGANGAYVFDGPGDPKHVPAFQVKSVYKIGSGDIFSSTFAHYWAEAGLDAAVAAEKASLQTANYVETRLLPCPKVPPVRHAVEFAMTPERMVYLGGPFFNAPQRWLIEEARNGLLDLGLKVFSPFHDVGFGSETVAEADISGLKNCNIVLALLPEMDPGTLFEVGYARSMGIPVVVYSEGMRPQDPTMLTGSGCIIETDFTTALYRAAWSFNR
jgi:nucleoside 2-deoxyribosyltransferase